MSCLLAPSVGGLLPYELYTVKPTSMFLVLSPDTGTSFVTARVCRRRPILTTFNISNLSTLPPTATPRNPARARDAPAACYLPLSFATEPSTPAGG